MQTIVEKSRAIPVMDQVDVLVIGGGPAGFATALSAARQGAKTMIIEQSGDIGGVATTGLMSHWTGDTKGPLYEEILERSLKEETIKERPSRYTINPEFLKTLFLRMLSEAKVAVKLYTFACEAIVEDECIKGVIIESKSGREAILADVVVDASGDGDIAAKAGATFYKGRETDGAMQPMTLMFKVAGVKEEQAVFPGGFESYIEIPKGEIQALGKANLPQPAGHVLLYPSTLPGIVTINMTNCIGVDGTQNDDLTKATYLCREQMELIVAFLREFVPGFEACYIVSSASIIGVRETRHFKGEYTLTEEDIVEAKVFEDWIVTRAYFNFDIHNIKGSGLDEEGVQVQFKQKKGYTIPYRCFIPEKIENLLLAGRNISGTHKAHSNFRVMPICVNMGEGVGIAAALCAQQKISPRALAVKQIQDILMTRGVPDPFGTN